MNPDVGLFRAVANKRCIYPDVMSAAIPFHLKYFTAAGIALAKAMTDDIAVEVNFTKSILKMILGKPLDIDDLEEFDPSLY
mmetsp:Transcript_27536/g.24240  ORF Transcript_27536/g.24240 Transcript_27536/m.24240 type:complete len:81 (+) Transcript_27536:127-369(+)